MIKTINFCLILWLYGMAYDITLWIIIPIILILMVFSTLATIGAKYNREIAQDFIKNQIRENIKARYEDKKD